MPSSTEQYRSETDLKWIKERLEEIEVQIASHSFEDAVRNIEKGERSLSSNCRSSTCEIPGGRIYNERCYIFQN